MNGSQHLRTKLTSLEIIALVIAGFGAIALIYVGIIFFVTTDPILTPAGFSDDTNIGITSALGSLISGLGALFTLASVIYFVAALKISQRDLIETAKTQNLHQFENTFFKLIDLHNTIIDNLAYKDHIGRKVFADAVKHLGHAMNYYWTEDGSGELTILDHEDVPPPSTIAEARNKIKEDYYEYYYKEFEFEFNHYFRALFHVYRYLDRAELTEKQRITYSEIVRSKLSQNELHLIMFNSLHAKYGYPKLLYFVKKYDILDNFNSKLVTPKVFYNLFLAEVQKIKNPFKD